MAKQKDYLNALLGNGEGGATTSDSTAQSSQPRKTHGDKNAKAVPLDNGQSDKDESKAKPKNETDNMDGMAKGTATSPLAKNNPARNSQPPAQPDAPNAAQGSRAARRAGLSLLGGRENALARLASGEVKQVTQLQINPGKVRIWSGNARIHERLNADNCRELIDAIISENGQKMPAIVRRIPVDQYGHEYEVIAGTRRHFAISWLRQNHYPEMLFLAQVADLDDEAAFRLADIENRARKDVSDLERGRNYCHALYDHYDGQLTQMADRLNISKGWLSKMIRMGDLPDEIANCFASWHDLGVNPGYQLLKTMEEHPDRRAHILNQAKDIRAEQDKLRKRGEPLLSAKEVLKWLNEKPVDYSAAPRFRPIAFNGP